MEEHMNASSYVVLSEIYELLSHMYVSSAKDIHSADPSVTSAPIATIDPPTNDPPSYHDLITSNALTVGDRVFYSQRKGTRFYGDLLPDGRIRYSTGQTPSFEDLYFLSPTAFNNFCARMADPAYNKGNGFVYTFYKRNEDTVWVSLAEIRRLTFGD